MREIRKTLHQQLAKGQSYLKAHPNAASHFWQSLANYFSQASGLLISVALARLLTPEIFGQFSYAGAIFSLSMVATSWGLSGILITGGGQDPVLFKEILTLSWILLVLEFFIGIAVASFFAASGNLAISIILYFFLFQHLVARLWSVLKTDLEARGDFFPHLLNSIITIPFSGVLSVVCAYWGFGVYSLCIPLALGAVCSFIIFFRCNPRSLVPIKIPKAKLIQYSKSGGALWLLVVADTVQTRLDRVILGTRLGDAELGYYNRALNFSPLSYLVLQSFMHNAAVSSLARAKSSLEQKRILVKTYAVVLTASILNFIPWFFFSESLVPFIFGNQWIDAIPVFKAFATLALGYCLMQIPATYLLATKRYWIVGSTRLASTLIFLTCLFIYKDKISIVGMAVFLQVSIFFAAIIFSIITFFCLRVSCRQHTPIS